jgi:hypothetical protein
MDLIVAATEADAPFASELERAIARSGVFRAVGAALIGDEVSLAALIEEKSKERDLHVVVVVSRALFAGVKSIVGLDDALSMRIDGRRACFVVVRSGAAAPPAGTESTWTRRDWVGEDSTAEHVARELVDRITGRRDEDEPVARLAGGRFDVKHYERSWYGGWFFGSVLDLILRLLK